MSNYFNEFCEKMFDKYIQKRVLEICKETFDKNFEEVFKLNCESDCLENSTIDRTYEVLHDMAQKRVKETICNHLEEVDFTLFKLEEMNPSNPMYPIIPFIWGKFTDYIFDYKWTKETVKDFINGECYERQNILYANGIIDFDGNFVRIESLTRG